MPTSEAQRFKTLIGPYLDDLFRAAFRLAGNKPDAEDLVQETCLRAYPRTAEIARADYPIGWLLRVQHNLFIDGVRRQQRSPVRPFPDAAESPGLLTSRDPGPEELTDRSDRECQLQEAWLKLDRTQRALLALRAEGYTLAEIQKITGLAKDVLNARLYRARLRLAKYLKTAQSESESLTQLEAKR